MREIESIFWLNFLFGNLYNEKNINKKILKIRRKPSKMGLRGTASMAASYANSELGN